MWGMKKISTNTFYQGASQGALTKNISFLGDAFEKDGPTFSIFSSCPSFPSGATTGSPSSKNEHLRDASIGIRGVASPQPIDL